MVPWHQISHVKRKTVNTIFFLRIFDASHFFGNFEGKKLIFHKNWNVRTDPLLKTLVVAFYRPQTDKNWPSYSQKCKKRVLKVGQNLGVQNVTPGSKRLHMGLLGVLNSHSRERSSKYRLELTQKTLQKCGNQPVHVKLIFWYRWSLLVTLFPIKGWVET